MIQENIADTTFNSYSYYTYRPDKLSLKRGELPGHRYMYTQRRNRLIKGKEGLSYKSQCTCRQWINPYGFTSRDEAYKHWLEHMAEVRKQGSLW